jgi:hypothetical protein
VAKELAPHAKAVSCFASRGFQPHPAFGLSALTLPLEIEVLSRLLTLTRETMEDE